MATATRAFDVRLTGAGLAAAMAAVTAWAVGPILVKLTDLSGLALSLYRLWLGFAFMAVVHLAVRGRLRWETIRRSALGGALFGIDVALFFSAVKLTSVADATLITALQPALVLLVAGRWFGERVGAREVGLTAVAIGGVVVVVLASAGTPVWSLRGDALAAAALLAWTGYFLVTKRVRATMPTVEYMTGVMLWAAVVASPLALVAGPGELELPSGRDWALLAGFVLVPGAMGHLLMSWAQRYVDVSLSSTIVVGMPVVSVALAVPVLGEPLTLVQAGAGLVVVVAIAALVRTPGSPVAEEPEAAVEPGTP